MATVLPDNVVVAPAAAPSTLVSDDGTQYTFIPRDTTVRVRRTRGKVCESYHLSLEEARYLYRRLRSKLFYRW